MNLPPGSQMKIARAIIQASSTTSKPRRYFPWQFGISYDEIGRDSGQNLFDEQLDVRDLLRSQTSVSWVIVSTGMFISFLFEPSFGLVNAERTAVTAIGSWDNALTVTAPEDIGRITAELVLSHGNVQGIVYTAGDTVSFHQLAGIMEDVKGGPITKHLKTVEQLEADLAAQPDDGMRKYRLVSSFFHLDRATDADVAPTASGFWTWSWSSLGKSQIFQWCSWDPDRFSRRMGSCESVRMPLEGVVLPTPYQCRSCK